MMKKKIIIVTTIVVALISMGAAINYYIEKSPKKQIEYNLVKDLENSEQYLSENFLKKIE